jgi:hypothetical protein
MRPNHVVTAADNNGRLALSGLYYSGRKARRAFERLRRPDADGWYTIMLEDGRHEGVQGEPNWIIKIRSLGDHIWTSRNRWKKSFFDTTEEEFEELSIERDIPVNLLKQIARCELDFIEDRGNTRSDARKRFYLPRTFYNWL